MQACTATLPPQLQAASDAGQVTAEGDCNLGTAGATEVVCHYHSGHEFTSRSEAPPAPSRTVEVHCIAFKLEHGERVPTPIVFGTQLQCKDGTMPDEAHAGDGHAARCGQLLPGIFKDGGACDMRCCREGTLTNANPGMAVRPSFAICANRGPEVDCGEILAGMHAHAPHRPHDRIGPAELYQRRRAKAAAFDEPAPVQRETKPKVKKDQPPLGSPETVDPLW
jgi:hypothetical protein